MAADQWRKRLNSASVVSSYGREQHRAKRKNSGVSQFDSNMKSHVSLEWDVNQKRVVARKEQIGINRKDMRPFMAPSPSTSNVVADVIAVPQELFGLENLKEVLTYEVWESYMSESEKNHLMQFLPRGPETEQVLRSLLAGDEFHFGNPFLNWGNSVCSGEFHPDAISMQDRRIRAVKKAYYGDLHKYHNNMIGDLLKLKERFECCKDPEEEIVQKTWRLGNNMDKRVSSSANNSRFNPLEDNCGPSSESCSSDADENPCSSDNQNLTMMIKGGELRSRLGKKGSSKDNRGDPSAFSSDVNQGAKLKKGDKHHQPNIPCDDGAKYMSYVKISKKQHEIVKNMKQSGKSIQSKSLNRVLGDSFNVQPYEVFVEEEQKKLRDHWIHLATKTLPVSFANWRDLNLLRQQLRKSLEHDLEERLSKSLTEDVEDCEEHDTTVQDHIENTVEDQVPTPEGDEKSLSSSPQEESQEDFSSGKEFESMEMESEKPVVSRSDDATLNPSADYSGNANSADDVEIGQGVDLSCGGDVWPTGNISGNISHSYYDSTASHEYASDEGLTIAPPKGNDEQPTHLVDLEPSLQVGDSGKDMVHTQDEDTSFRQPDDGSFGSYSNPDRNELFPIQALFKGDDMLMYHHHHHEPKQSVGLDFQSTNPMLMEDNQFPGHGHFREQPHPPLPMEPGLQKRENDAYLHRNISDNVYSDGGRYLIPRQEPLAGVDVQDWAVNSVRMPPPPPLPMQSHLNGDLSNWFSSDHQVRSGWPGPGGGGGASVPTQSIGIRNGGDQSLYSVLSQCNQFRSNSPYQVAEQFIQPRNYGMMGMATNPSIGNVPMQSVPHPLDYMTGREAAPAMIPDDMGWMGLPPPHQSSGLHDPMGKPYLRSWNQ